MRSRQLKRSKIEVVSRKLTKTSHQHRKVFFVFGCEVEAAKAKHPWGCELKANIGTTFELLDLYPVFNTIDSLDENGNQQFYKNGNVITKDGDEITGYMYAVKVLDGQFKRKTQTVKVNGIDPLMTIEKFYNSDDVKIKFENLRNSYIGQNGALSYLADSVSLSEENKIKKYDEKAGK